MYNNKKKKTAFVAYAFSQKNAGDLALLLGAFDILIKNNYNIVVVSRYDKENIEFKNTEEYLTARYGAVIKMIEAPFKLSRDSGIIRSILDHLHGALVLWGIIEKRQISKQIRNSDIVVFGGGNLLRCSNLTDYLRLLALYYPIQLAKKHDKKYYVFPQSTAEINRLGKRLIDKFLRGASAVFLREKLSFDKIRKIYGYSNLIETIDLAFFMKESGSFNGNLKPDTGGGKQKIAFTFRAQTVGDIKEFSIEERENIKNRIKDIVHRLHSNYDISFVVQTQKDRSFSMQLKNQLEDELGIYLNLIEEYDPANLIELYSNFDLLFGMRLHSIILAICGGTPGYGLFYKEWGLKNPGIMGKFGLPYIFMDGNEATVDYSKVEQLISSKPDLQKRFSEICNVEQTKFDDIL